MPVVGLKTRNPEHLLMKAKPTFLIKNYADPKLWAALEELGPMDRKAGAATGTARDTDLRNKPSREYMF